MRHVVAIAVIVLLSGCARDTLNRGSWDHGYIPKSQRDSYREVIPND